MGVRRVDAIDRCGISWLQLESTVVKSLQKPESGLEHRHEARRKLLGLEASLPS